MTLSVCCLSVYYTATLTHAMLGPGFARPHFKCNEPLPPHRSIHDFDRIRFVDRYAPALQAQLPLTHEHSSSCACHSTAATDDSGDVRPTHSLRVCFSGLQIVTRINRATNDSVTHYRSASVLLLLLLLMHKHPLNCSITSRGLYRKIVYCTAECDLRTKERENNCNSRREAITVRPTVFSLLLERRVNA